MIFVKKIFTCSICQVFYIFRLIFAATKNLPVKKPACYNIFTVGRVYSSWQWVTTCIRPYVLGYCIRHIRLKGLLRHHTLNFSTTKNVFCFYYLKLFLYPFTFYNFEIPSISLVFFFVFN